MGSPALTLSLLHSALVDGTINTTNGVCFSPDGKLLATAIGNGVIRVSSRTFMLAIVIAVIIIFKANSQHGTTFCALGLGHRREANPQKIQGSHPAGQLGRFLVGREIPRLWVGRS